MFRLQILLITLLILGSCSSTRGRKAKYEYWNETKFTWEWVEKDINDKNCHENVDKFFACIEAMNFLLIFSKEDWYILPGKSFLNSKKEPSFFKWAYQSHYFLIDEFPKNKEAITNFLKDGYSSANNGLKKRWVKFYKKSRFPFESFMSSLLNHLRKQEVITREKEKYFASEVYNQFLKNYIDPKAYLFPRAETFDKNFKPDLEIVGIGIQTSFSKDGFKVVDVLEGGPGAKAGLFYGDLITGIKKSEDSKFESLVGLEKKPKESFSKGAIGTELILNVKRGEKNHRIKVIRNRVTFKEIDHKTLTLEDKKILHLRINSFYWSQFCQNVDKIIHDNQDVDGIILDLRDNPGGSIQSSYCLADLFLERGKNILRKDSLKYDYKQKDKISRSQNIISQSNSNYHHPLVVLVNKWSASASEIVASSLQDNLRAIVVGERTFGKGTIQYGVKKYEKIPYLKDNSDLYLYYTRALFKRPAGTYINGDGVTPNLYLSNSPKKDNTEKRPYWLRKMQNFQGFFIDEKSKDKKWSFSSSQIIENDKLKKCFFDKKLFARTKKIYAKNLGRGNVLHAPDFPLLQALEVFKCYI